jgi:hypothetical protein
MMMSTVESRNLPHSRQADPEDYAIGAWVEGASASAPNRPRLQCQLDSIASVDAALFSAPLRALQRCACRSSTVPGRSHPSHAEPVPQSLEAR